MKNRFIDYVIVVTVLLFVIAFWKFAVFTLGSFILCMAILVLVEELFN